MQRMLLAAILIAAVTTQARADEHWQATSTTASSITGDVIFAPNKITFGNKKSLPLADARKSTFVGNGKSADAMIYRVTAPTDLQLIRGNRLCDGKPVNWIVVWNPPKVGSDVAPRSMSPFSGTAVPTSDSSPGSCGIFNYDAGTSK